jgi:hypothetical protein
MITQVEFGRITIAGRRYETDLIIYPDGRVTAGWRRKSGHRLTFEDLRPLVAAAPELIVAGTGVYGRMAPEPTLAAQLASLGIAFSAAVNREAAAHFNRHWLTGRVGGCFHLTC